MAVSTCDLNRSDFVISAGLRFRFCDLTFRFCDFNDSDFVI